MVFSIFCFWIQVLFLCVEAPKTAQNEFTSSNLLRSYQIWMHYVFFDFNSITVCCQIRTYQVSSSAIQFWYYFRYNEPLRWLKMVILRKLWNRPNICRLPLSNSRYYLCLWAQNDFSSLNRDVPGIFLHLPLYLVVLLQVFKQKGTNRALWSSSVDPDISDLWVRFSVHTSRGQTDLVGIGSYRDSGVSFQTG